MHIAQTTDLRLFEHIPLVTETAEEAQIRPIERIQLTFRIKAQSKQNPTTSIISNNSLELRALRSEFKEEKKFQAFLLTLNTRYSFFASFPSGALAQLVERLHGMQEVRSSTLLCSTIFRLPSRKVFFVPKAEAQNIQVGLTF